MAQTATARNCRSCGTLTTVAGNFADEFLEGNCPTCRAPMRLPNPSAPPAARDVTVTPAEREEAFAPTPPGAATAPDGVPIKTSPDNPDPKRTDAQAF